MCFPYHESQKSDVQDADMLLWNLLNRQAAPTSSPTSQFAVVTMSAAIVASGTFSGLSISLYAKTALPWQAEKHMWASCTAATLVLCSLTSTINQQTHLTLRYATLSAATWLLVTPHYVMWPLFMLQSAPVCILAHSCRARDYY